MDENTSQNEQDSAATAASSAESPECRNVLLAQIRLLQILAAEVVSELQKENQS